MILCIDPQGNIVEIHSTLFLTVKVDSAWIAYNKPKSPELANEYAGFLMALGLNGHLTKLATLNIHDYLTKVLANKAGMFTPRLSQHKQDWLPQYIYNSSAIHTHQEIWL